MSFYEFDEHRTGIEGLLSWSHSCLMILLVSSHYVNVARSKGIHYLLCTDTGYIFTSKMFPLQKEPHKYPRSLVWATQLPLPFMSRRSARELRTRWRRAVKSHSSTVARVVLSIHSLRVGRASWYNVTKSRCEAAVMVANSCSLLQSLFHGIHYPTKRQVYGKARDAKSGACHSLMVFRKASRVPGQRCQGLPVHDQTNRPYALHEPVTANA